MTISNNPKAYLIEEGKMKIVSEDAESTVLEMRMDEAREVAAELDKNAKIVGAAGAELRKLLPESAESPSGATRYEYSGAHDL